MTFTMLARDPRTGDLGIAVQSHFFAVGRVVPWAAAGVGVVATQAVPDIGYGPRGLDLLRSGASGAEALDRLVAADGDAAVRQVAVMDAQGGVAVHTGRRCVEAAGSRVSGPACAMGNMLARPSCWDAMVDAYESATGELADRLLAALDAADDEGGDIRGRQSAAVLVVAGERTERPWDGVVVDLRVDDHVQPLTEIARLVAFDRAYRTVGSALFTPGLLTGDGALDADTVDDAVRGLAIAQEQVLPNPEPTLWRGVLLARAGRSDEARTDLRWAVQRHPPLAEFVRRLAVIDVLPQATLDLL